MAETEYWKERSRLLEEYVHHLPPASAFNAEGRAAHKEWQRFVNTEGIPMPPTEPVFTEAQVKAMVDELFDAVDSHGEGVNSRIWNRIAAKHGITLP